MLAAVAIFSAVSCNKELSQDLMPSGNIVTFEATVDGAESKTVLNGAKSMWSGQEWIQVVGTKAYWFGTENIATPSEKAIFSYNGDNGEYTEQGALMAVAPAGSKDYTADLTAKKVSCVSVETSQTAVEGSYDCDGALMVAYAAAGESTFAFKNVAALLKFTMGSDNVGKVTFWGTDETGANAVVSGSGNVSYNDGNPVFEATTEGGKTYVELTNSSKFTKGKVYYIAIIPGKFKSLTVEFDGIAAKSKTFDEVYELGRNTILDLGSIEAKSTGRVIVGSSVDLGSWTPSKGIQFVEGTNYYEAKNVTVSASDEFKIVINGEWFSPQTVLKGQWCSMINGANIKLAEGTNDFYLTKEDNKLYIAAAGTAEPAAPGVVLAKEGYLYMKPNSNWTQAGARFAAYFFGNGDTWVSMTDPDGDGIYEVKVPTTKTYPSVIFCRMNPAATANNWDNKWNQSSDLTVPTNGNNLYTVEDGIWDGGDVNSWPTVTEF